MIACSEANGSLIRSVWADAVVPRKFDRKLETRSVSNVTLGLLRWWSSDPLTIWLRLRNSDCFCQRHRALQNAINQVIGSLDEGMSS